MSKKDIPLAKLVDMSFAEIEKRDKYCLFYDWFCGDEELPDKSRSLLEVVRSIVKAVKKTGRFDPEKCYAFFKNECPGHGEPYDDIRICDIKTGSVLFCVCPSDSRGRVMVYTKGHGFESDTDGIEFDSVRKMIKWFGTKDSSLLYDRIRIILGGVALPGKCVVVFEDPSVEGMKATLVITSLERDTDKRNREVALAIRYIKKALDGVVKVKEYHRCLGTSLCWLTPSKDLDWGLF